MDDKLKYVDERDKSYGMAGMAISMMMLDGENYLEAMTLDAPAGDSVEFSHDFYFIGNPRMSAKIAWNEILKHFQISSGMVIANMMCRNYVQHRHKLPTDIIESLRAFVRDEAEEDCQLERDEADAIFEKNYNYFDRLFTYSQVHQAAHDLAAALVRQRRMSALEIIEQLRVLSML